MEENFSEYKTAKRLVSQQGFINEHLSLIGRGWNGEDAFEYLNEIYANEFGVYRYSDYNSFKASKSRFQNS